MKPVSIHIAGLFHLGNNLGPFATIQQMVGLGMARQLRREFRLPCQIPWADSVKIAHNHVGPVAVASGPGAQRAQLCGACLLVRMVQMRDIDCKRLVIGKKDTRLQQTALLFCCYGGQMMGSIGDDGPARKQGVPVGIGGHVILGRPAQAGAKDKVHVQPLCQGLQGRRAITLYPRG